MSKNKLPDGKYFKISPNCTINEYDCTDVTYLDGKRTYGSKQMLHRHINAKTKQKVNPWEHYDTLQDIYDLYATKDQAIAEAQRLIDKSIITAKTMLLNAEKRQMNLNASK